MKSINAIVHLILFVAVVVLYFLHFSGTGSTPVAEDNKQADTLRAQLADLNKSEGPVILFVNSDSLFENYEYVKTVEKSLKSEKERLESSLDQKMKKLEQDFMDLQQKYQGGQLTMEQAAAREQELMERRDVLAQTQQEYSVRFMEQTEEKNKLLQDAITDYLEKYNLDKNVSYVLGYQPGGVILFGRDSLDITRQVIDGLNKEYQEKQEADKKKK